VVQPNCAIPSFIEARRALLIGGAAAGLIIGLAKLFSTPSATAAGDTSHILARESYEVTDERK
jgi:spermidine/putrescine transport system substrate-binding protein